MYSIADIGKIKKQIKWIVSQLNCLKEKGCLCFGFETSLEYNEETGELTSNYVDDSSRSTPLNIPRNTSDLNNNSDFITVDDIPDVPEYELSPISGSNEVQLIKDGTAISTINLTPYLDDTNLARLTNGTLNSTTGIATFERDDSSTFTVDFSSLIDIQPQNTSDLDNDGEDGTSPFVTQANLPQYTLSPISGSNQVNLLQDGNVVSTIDLSPYLDDTNLARLTSGIVNSTTGIATFTRDDNTTFTVDFSNLLFSQGVNILDSTGALQFTSEEIQFDENFLINSAENEIQLNDEKLRLLSGRNNNINTFIPSNIVENTVVEDSAITLGKIFEIEHFIYKMLIWFRLTPANGGVDSGTVTPTRITYEYYLRPQDSSINISNNGVVNEISLFELIAEGNELLSFQATLENKAIDFLINQSSTGLGSTARTWSNIIFAKKRYDYNGNIVESTPATYTLQSNSYTGPNSQGDIVISDININLYQRITFEFADSLNSNGLNDRASTVLVYYALINEKI